MEQARFTHIATVVAPQSLQKQGIARVLRLSIISSTGEAIHTLPVNIDWYEKYLEYARRFQLPLEPNASVQVHYLKREGAHLPKPQHYIAPMQQRTPLIFFCLETAQTGPLEEELPTQDFSSFF